MVFLNSQRAKLYHVGIRGRVSRATLADASERRDWRLIETLGQRSIAIAVELYRDEDSRGNASPWMFRRKLF